MASRTDSESRSHLNMNGTSAAGGRDHPPNADDTPLANPQGTGSSMLKRIWAFTELDIFTLLLMAKGGIPPALALGLLQVTVIADHFSTIGYGL